MVEEEGVDREFSAPRLRRAFYPVLLSEDLRDRPREVTLWGQKFVVFRDESGVPRTLKNACPHRNAPLSEGTCEGGRLSCPYHGWRFEGSGKVVQIPGLVDLGKKEYRATSFETKEEYGLVWVKPLAGEPLYPSVALPLFSDVRYTTLVREVSAEASVHAICENALDVPHTSILHRGLFRGGKRNLISGEARRNQLAAEIEYKGEPPPSGLLAWLLSVRAGAGTVSHFDRFFLPGIAQVEYQLGEKAHFSITGFCSPVSDTMTKFFAVASFRTPLPGALLAWLLEPIAMRVFRQDAVILRQQSLLIAEAGGPRFVSTEIDAMGPMIWRLLRAAARHEETAEAPPIAAGDWKSHAFSLWA